MTTGIYTTTNPNIRIRVVQDTEPPVEGPDLPYAEGELDDLMECYESGDYYGVIVEHKTRTINQWENLATGCNDDVISEEWITEDSIWSCAGYGDDVAKIVAKEFFDIEVTGEEI